MVGTCGDGIDVVIVVGVVSVVVAAVEADEVVVVDDDGGVVVVIMDVNSDSVGVGIDDVSIDCSNMATSCSLDQ